MAAPSLTVGAPPRRLDPFLLPTATASRFLLLIILTLSTGALSAPQVVAAFSEAGYLDRLVGCADRAQDDALTTRPEEVTAAFTGCADAAGRDLAVVAAAGALLTLLAVVAGHLLRARRDLRRRVPVPLMGGSYPRSAELVRDLAEQAGVRVHDGSVVVEAATGKPFGRAFGHWGRYHVAVSRDLVLDAERGSPTTLRAVVRHELAHLRNNDVDITGLTIVAGWVLPVVAVLPLLATMLPGEPSPRLERFGWIALLLVTVLLVRTALLRSREHFADVRASIAALFHGEPPFVAEACLDDRPSAAGWPAQIRRAVDDLHRFHPPADRRALVVADPGWLLRARFAEALATGITAGAVLVNLDIIGGVSLDVPGVGSLLVMFVVGALLAAVVGTALWRDSLRAMATGDALPSGVLPGLGVAAGVLGGLWIGESPLLRAAWAEDPGMVLLAAAVLAGGAVLLTRWIVLTAAAWLPVAGAGAMRSVLRGAHVVLAGAVAAGLTGWLGLISRIGSGLRRSDVLGAVVSIATFPTTVLMLVIAAVFPLCAATRAARPAAAQPLVLDTRRMCALPRLSLRPAVVLGASAAAGGVFAAVELAALPVHMGLAQTLALAAFGQADGVGVVYAFNALIGVIVVAAMGLATGLTAREPGSGPIHALGTGVLASVILSVLYTGLSIRDACATEDPSCAPESIWAYYPSLLLIVLGWSLLLAAGPAGLMVLGCAAIRRPTTAAAPGRVRRPRWSARLAWLIIGMLGSLVVLPLLLFVAVLVLTQFAGHPLDRPSDRSVAGTVDIAEPTPGSVPMIEACATVQRAFAGGQVDSDLQATGRSMASVLLGTDDPALRAFARMQQDGRFSRSYAGGLAAARYCEVRRQGADQ